ncbi:MAG: hypothetical protein DWQ36_17005 [Acidobacteria bacterium]|nr:MAG: hypothetical protein DWQ30_05100 [Acidobacteriota bacterium]REK04550.1 MAG: hypothetical protein DWQ36_17005 [Acidobacteriota bacterium]
MHRPSPLDHQLQTRLDACVDAYDAGRLDRRHLLAGIASLLAAAGTSAPATGAAQPGGDEPTFAATGLDHIALAVADPQRSSAFYQRHLGLRETSSSASSVFLDCGENFVALFRSQRPGLAHYSYAVAEYTQEWAAGRLRAAGLEPKLRGSRTYFDDPDGIEVQISRG